MKRITIIVTTNTKNKRYVQERAQEIIRALQPLVLTGETIEHEIEDVEEEKQESDDKRKKEVKR